MSRGPVAEGIGTGMLLYLIVGSGIAAESLGGDGALQLIAHAVAVGLGLGVLIAVFQTASGSHFNPAVTVAFWRSGDMDRPEAARYVFAQVTGAVVGVLVANLSFGQRAVSISGIDRASVGTVVAEALATFVLVLVVLALVRTDRAATVPVAVGAWVIAVVFATSSTGFANPAVTVARVLSDTYTGIAPASAVAFVVIQVLAGLGAASASRLLYPQPVLVEAST